MDDLELEAKLIMYCSTFCYAIEINQQLQDLHIFFLLIFPFLSNSSLDVPYASVFLQLRIFLFILPLLLSAILFALIVEISCLSL